MDDGPVVSIRARAVIGVIGLAVGLALVAAGSWILTAFGEAGLSGIGLEVGLGLVLLGLPMVATGVGFVLRALRDARPPSDHPQDR